MEKIVVIGARTHNLKNITTEIPRGKLVVITGPSGSGKSSLAFDTVYAEGQRRFAESLSAYARLVLGAQARADVDAVDGLTPTVALAQNRTRAGSRSTVGTLSEINDYARLLFARAGSAYCPKHDVPLVKSGIHDMVNAALACGEGIKVAVLAPMPPLFFADSTKALRDLHRLGFVRLYLNGRFVSVEALSSFSQDAVVTDACVVVDRLRVADTSRVRLAESFETACALAGGRAAFLEMDTGVLHTYSEHYGCPICGFTVPDLTPALFSFNNALGACQRCQGTGILEDFDENLVVRDASLTLRQGAVCGLSPTNTQAFTALLKLSEVTGLSMDTPWKDLPEASQKAVLYGQENGGKCLFEGVIEQLRRRWSRARSESVKAGMAVLRSRRTCPECAGSRLRRDMQCVYVGQGQTRLNIVDFSEMTLENLQKRLQILSLDASARAISQTLLKEIDKRLGFLIDAGLGYLTLSRPVATLSGGELQRIRLAGQLGSGLSGVTYVLDEPTVGLHPRDTARLIQILRDLVRAGNSVLVVEHDADVIMSADWVIDMGPGAGKNGGCVVASGTPKQILNNPESLTGAYLSGKKRVIPVKKRKIFENKAQYLTICGATGRNLKNITCSIPLGALTAVTGVSGSGKTTLILETLAQAMRVRLYGAKEKPQPFLAIDGAESVDKVVLVDQSTLGRVGRATLATYTGVMVPIRALFAQTPMARERGYAAGRFSFNAPGGRCEACSGEGETKIEMGFLPPVFVKCPVCLGKRFNAQTLDVRFKGKNIADVLNMTVAEALEFFSAQPEIERRLQFMVDIGLGYMQLGERADTFSGGEAQRIRLAEELSKKSTGRTLYILDEPTTGLHFQDVMYLLKALERLTEQGNTVVVIEHDLNVIASCDWVVDLGPGGGDAGGKILAQGTPKEVSSNVSSVTGQFLRACL